MVFLEFVSILWEFFFSYILWFLILCFMCVCVCACVHVFFFSFLPFIVFLYLPACVIKREGRHDGGGGESLGGDERGAVVYCIAKIHFQ